jgi:hypothetical protein
MERLAGRMCRVAMIAICFVSGFSVAGDSVGDRVAGQVEEDGGSKVFGVTVSGDGSALPGVLISLSAGKVRQKTVSGTDGEFSFSSVPPGDYIVVFQAQGKKKVKRKIPVATGDVDLGTIVVD